MNLSKSEQWAYSAGVKAYRKGRSLDANPYFFECDHGGIWEDGWEDARLAYEAASAPQVDRVFPGASRSNY